MANVPCGELLAAIENSLICASQLKGGIPVKKNDRVVRYVGGFCLVVPYMVNGTKKALRCWHVNVADLRSRSRIVSDCLKKLTLPYFIGFQYVKNGIKTSLGTQPIIIMDWAEGKPLKEYIKTKIENGERTALTTLADKFKKMVTDLHKHQISHGDLQHGNILVKDNGSIILVDYDSMFVPGLESYSDEIKGLKGYQHDARWTNEYATPKADYFSELVIYLTLIVLAEKPELWDSLKMENSEWLLFSAEDINSKGSTPIFHELCEIEKVKKLVEKLKEFMNASTIDSLEPLESYVTSPAEVICKKWGDGNGYQPTPSKRPNISSIQDKWQKH